MRKKIIPIAFVILFICSPAFFSLWRCSVLYEKCKNLFQLKEYGAEIDGVVVKKGIKYYGYWKGSIIDHYSVVNYKIIKHGYNHITQVDSKIKMYPEIIFGIVKRYERFFYGKFNHEEGDRVLITYLPSDPYIAKVGKKHTSGFNIIYEYFFTVDGFFSLVFMFISVGGVVLILKNIEDQ